MSQGPKVISEIIHPELEPGVINHEMIRQAIEDNYHKGEAGRLERLEEVEYNSVEVLRLDFQNILRIDHLWVLPNLTKLSLNFNRLDKIENLDTLVALKELDLSFNYIEKIENLDNLKNLEILSLFNNEIELIENLDSLENLIILSLGNNKISTPKGIERFRFLSKLHCLNLEGNPLQEVDGYPLKKYIHAVLPNLKYYQYAFIMNEMKEEASALYELQLRQIEENEQEEIELREKRAKAIADEQRLSSSFVENLNEHQLFESLFENDEDGRALRMIGDDAEELIKEYRNDIYAITQQIYQLGLEKHEERLHEIEMFEECVREGQKRAQIIGQTTVENFLAEKEDIFSKTKTILKRVEAMAAHNEEADAIEGMEDVEKQLGLFNARMDYTWQQLMEEEVQLFETVEEATAQFDHTIQDLMNQFIEQAQTYFVQLRDVSLNFSDALSEAVTGYITFMSASGAEDKVPQELKECLEDKDAIMNLIAGMRDNHMQKIDAREDRLVSRGRQWVSSLIEEMQKSEIQRNRAKIMEINYFLDQMKESFEQLQADVHEEALKEEGAI